MEKEHEYRYINPLTDFGFKRIFGTEANIDILIDFLNCILPLKSPVVEIHFRNSEQTPSTKEDRKAIYDLYCHNEKGEEFVIEMQKGKLVYFRDRTLFYLTFPWQRMAERGDWNFKLEPIYYLAILDFLYESESAAQLERHVQLKDQFNQVFYDKLMLTYIQLPAFSKSETELENRKEQWLYFLKNLENMEKNIAELFHQDKIFKKVLTIAEIANLSPEDAKNYNISRSQYLEIKGIADTAYDEGLQEAEEKYLEMINELNAEIKQVELKAQEERKQKEEERKQKEEERKQKEEERKQKEEAKAKAEEITRLFVLTLYNSGKKTEEIQAITKISIVEIEKIIDASQ